MELDLQVFLTGLYEVIGETCPERLVVRKAILLISDGEKVMLIGLNAEHALVEDIDPKGDLPMIGERLKFRPKDAGDDTFGRLIGEGGGG